MKVTQEDRLREYRAQLKADVTAVLQTPAGRRLVWHVLESICGTFGPTFEVDNAISNFKQGARAAGLTFQKLLQENAPVEFVHLLGEQMGLSLERIRLSNPREDE